MALKRPQNSLATSVEPESLGDTMSPRTRSEHPPDRPISLAAALAVIDSERKANDGHLVDSLLVRIKNKLNAIK